MDFDWSFNLVLLIFFCFAGALYGVLQGISDGESNANIQSIRSFPRWTNYIFMLILIIATLIAFQIFRADSARSEGDYAMSIRQKQDGAVMSSLAIGHYQESARLNPYEPLTWYEIWSAYYDMGDYKNARIAIEKAIALFPENGMYYGALATTDEDEKDYSDYEEHLTKAIQYFPAGSLTNQWRLADYYFTNKKYDSALAVINKVLPIYTHYKSVLWYSSDPNSPVMSANLIKLNDLKAKILLISPSTK